MCASLCERMLQSLGGNEPALVHAIRQECLKSITSRNPPTVGALAERLNLSLRTLHRRLAEVGFNCQDVIEDFAQSTRQGIARQYGTEYRRHRRARRIFGCLQLPQGFQTLDEQDASGIPKRCRLARSHRPIAWTPPTPFRSGEPDERRRHRAALLVFTVVQSPILAETCESRSAPWHWLARLRG